MVARVREAIAAPELTAAALATAVGTNASRLSTYATGMVHGRRQCGSALTPGGHRGPLSRNWKVTGWPSGPVKDS